MTYCQWKLILLVLVIVQLAHQAPLDPKPADGQEEEAAKDTKDDNQDPMGLEYERYLREVIKVLESDPEMKAKMEEMSTDDLLNGELGRHVNFVGNHIRNQLDELKRTEIQRLRMVARKMMTDRTVSGQKKPDQKFLDNLIGHLDPTSLEKFSPDDLTKLVQKASKDLDEADKERRREFKRYEMEKELKRRSQLNHMDATQREAAEREYAAEREKQKHHAKINHPGSKKQLEEVWEKTDHLDRDTFDPKTFFFLHDTNGDKYLDAFELEALFFKEVEKIYKGKTADAQEKFEEVARMREHVLDQIDTDKDQLVSLKEFVDASKTEDFDDNSEWEDINQQDQFTEEDLRAYQDQLQKTLDETKRKMAEAGDQFVKLRQPNREEPVVMDQAHAQQIKEDLTAGLPPLGDNQPGSNKLQFTDNDPQPPAPPQQEQQPPRQAAQPPSDRIADPPADRPADPPAQPQADQANQAAVDENVHPPPKHEIPELLVVQEGNQILGDPQQGGVPPEN